jgi:hypothetical protein
MAKGNVGNLLQHFVALRCAEVLLSSWSLRSELVLYVDCFSMAPWEPVEGDNPQGFVGIIERFEEKAKNGDRVAQAFLTAWQQHYLPEDVPAHPQHRDYPNTASLLRAAFPHQSWLMRLHDVVPWKRTALEKWGNEQMPGNCAVGGAWKESLLIQRNPVSPDRACFVILDPYQIVPDQHPKASEGGYLAEQDIKYLFGRFGLNMITRPIQPGSAPGLITLFSYADANRKVTNQIVLDRFSSSGWNIESVSSGPWNTFGNPDNYHLGWVVSCRLPTPILGQSLQAAWDDWSR